MGNPSIVSSGTNCEAECSPHEQALVASRQLQDEGPVITISKPPGNRRLRNATGFDWRHATSAGPSNSSIEPVASTVSCWSGVTARHEKAP